MDKVSNSTTNTENLVSEQRIREIEFECYDKLPKTIRNKLKYCMKSYEPCWMLDKVMRFSDNFVLEIIKSNEIQFFKTQALVPSVMPLYEPIRNLNEKY
jgi:hypothetical protein